MSQINGNPSHEGSSLSIFSGLGTSSGGSGTSEVGHVNVDELSDNALSNLVEETQRSMRRLTLETKMFEGYYERLTSAGGLDFKWPHDAGQKTSMSNATFTSDSTPESDSLPPTAGTSLLDLSHGGGSRATDRRYVFTDILSFTQFHEFF